MSKKSFPLFDLWAICTNMPYASIQCGLCKWSPQGQYAGSCGCMSHLRRWCCCWSKPQGDFHGYYRMIMISHHIPIHYTRCACSVYMSYSHGLEICSCGCLWIFWRPPTVSLANLQHRVTQCRKPFTPAGESACHADPSYGRNSSPNVGKMSATCRQHVGNMSANTCNNFRSVPNRKIGILQLVNRLRLGFCVAFLGAVDITKMSIQYSPRAFWSLDMCVPGSSNVRLGL